MTRSLKIAFLYLPLVLLIVAHGVVLGCGGGGGKKKDDDEEEARNDPPALFDMSGFVRGNDGAPIADASVTARRGDGSHSGIFVATSAADGSYSITVPEATPFYLHVEKSSYATTNSHVRQLTAARTDVDVVLLLEGEADVVLSSLGGPQSLDATNVLYLVWALDASGGEMADVNVNVTPIGLLVLYRLPDDSGFDLAGPTVACTDSGGCTLPPMAGYSSAIHQGMSNFHLAPVGGVAFATVVAPLLPGEVTFVAND